jgi:antirestriction protein ArdC
MTSTKTPAKTDKVAESTSSVVSALIAMIESGADGSGWKRVWRSLSRPGGAMNVCTGKRYTGGNYITLVIAEVGGAVGPWATYNQWTEMGAQVRKGERSTAILRPVPFDKKNSNGVVITDPETGLPKKGMFFQVFHVFASNQVDGYVRPAVETSDIELAGAPAKWLSEVLINGKVVIRDGEPAYIPSLDEITMPESNVFESAGAYFATLTHELGHWTGAEDRLNRSLSTRFGSAEYAAEELVAELTAALNCAVLGVEGEPHENHAQYIAHWLQALKEDPSRLWSAGAAAEAALTHLNTYTNMGERGSLMTSHL